MRLRVAAVVLGLAACSSTSHVHVRPAPADAVKGGTLRIGITTPGSLDPANAYDPAGEQVLAAQCEPLLQLDPMTGKLKPGLADFWIVTKQGQQLTVRMRHGVRYQGGGTVTATDAVNELSRVANLDTASYAADVYSDIKGYDTLHGITPSDDASAVSHFSGISALSDSSFAVSLSKPNGSFVTALAHPSASPVRKGTCAGPYSLVSSSASAVVLKQFGGYYGDNPLYTVGGRGYASTIEFHVFPTRAAELAALRGGRIDIAQVPDDKLRAAGPVVSAPNGYVEYVGLPGSGPFGDPAVHKALSQALDRTVIGNRLYGGGSLPASGFLPPTVGDAFQASACGDATPATASLADAKATLSAAGVSLLGKTLTLAFSDENGNAALASLIAAQWKQALGLTVTLTPMTWDAYRQMASGAGGFPGAFLEGWKGDVPTADAYLTPLLSSGSVSTDNFAHYTQGEFQNALSTARKATTADGLRLDYQGLEKRACSALPLVPLVFRQYHYAVSTAAVGSAVGSFTQASDGLLNLREIYVKHPS